MKFVYDSKLEGVLFIGCDLPILIEDKKEVIKLKKELNEALHQMNVHEQRKREAKNGN